jgi:hypothetical protein
MEESEIYQQALDWGRQNYHEAPEVYHDAFASLVQFACTGRNRRAVIKTMRTLVAMDVFYLKNSQPLSFDEAVDMFKDACYGDITIEHAKKWKHDHPKRDHEDDIEAAQILIATLHPTFIYVGERDQ